MKLKNKKTGALGTPRVSYQEFHVVDENGYTHDYESLQHMCEEWEDYKEPGKKHWYMTSWGEVWQYGDDSLHEEWRIILGNDFETKEEAEEAVEKLKAYKRLKDNGLKINRWLHTPDMKLTTGSFIKIEGYIPAVMKNIKDLDLLFGDEE